MQRILGSGQPKPERSIIVENLNKILAIRNAAIRVSSYMQRQATRKDADARHTRMLRH